MEMLAVVLLLAVLTSFALPVYRTIRFEMRHSQASQAAVKMAEAMRMLYAQSKGGTVTDCFTPTTESSKMTTTKACNNPRLVSGIPNTAGDPFTIEDLFACGFLSYKDFQGLPYTFCAKGTDDPLVEAKGLTQSGKYENSLIQVKKNMRVSEVEVEE